MPLTDTEIKQVMEFVALGLKSLSAAHVVDPQIEAAKKAAEAAEAERQRKIKQLLADAAALGVALPNVPVTASVALPVVAPQPPLTSVPMTSRVMDGIHYREDLPCPPGTPGTVTLPVTGHTVSVGQPGPNYGQGEMFVAYCQRVYRQCGAENANAVGSLFLGTDHLFRDIGGFKTDGSNWPEAADRFFNAAAYSPPPSVAAPRPGEIPPRPVFFSPISPEEKQIQDAWDAKYGEKKAPVVKAPVDDSEDVALG